MKPNIVFKRSEKAAISWEDFGRALEDGALKELLRVGDQVVAKHKELGKVVFNVLDHDREKLAGEQKHSITLQTHRLLLPEMPFDKNGCNKWENSTLRKELNKKDFIKGFEKGFRELLAEVYKKNDDREETKDTFFLLSAEEMTDEKEKYKYFKNRKRMIRTDEEGEPNWHWTRSAYRGHAYYTYYVTSTGSVYGYTASNANACAPACVIAK